MGTGPDSERPRIAARLRRLIRSLVPRRRGGRGSERVAAARVDSWVSRLLAGQAPAMPLHSAAERRAAMVATHLHSAGQRAARPSDAFSAELLERVQQQAARTGADGNGAQERPLRRRPLLVGGAAGLVTAGLAGAAARLLRGRPTPSAPAWVTLAAADSFPPGSVMPAMAGHAYVFVIGEAGGPRVISGACTDVGCPLSHGQGQLVCPCHGAAFDMAGNPMPGYWAHLPKLAQLNSRVRNGMLQVQPPPRA